MNPDFERDSDNPLPVSRGLKLHQVFFGLDSLYLVVEYPKLDVFEHWSKAVEDFHDVRLNEGVPFDGLVVRRGLVGYKLSVWDGDARLLITDRVEEALRGTALEGQGMGLMLQLGPKWLRLHGDSSCEELQRNVFGQLMRFGVCVPEMYPNRLNRVDLAIDVMGYDVSQLSMDEWRNSWVGYAKKMSFHTKSDSRDLEGLSVGTSAGSVRFKIYDKVAESRGRGTSRFWFSVWGVGEDDPVSISRFEWSVKCYEANFTELAYLSDLASTQLWALANYLVERWGRLTIPQSDKNQSRWPSAPVWVAIQRLVDCWTGGFTGYARREYEMRTDLNDSYLNSISGWLAGLSVRVAVERGEDKPAGFVSSMHFMKKRGFTTRDIAEKAGQKWKMVQGLSSS